MIDPTDGGVVLHLRVQPGAARAVVVGVHGDAIKVKVSAPPLDGRANAAVVELIAREFGVRPAGVELLSGLSSRNKRVLVHGISVHQAQEWLAVKAGHATGGL